jgi:hypothetical protein
MQSLCLPREAMLRSDKIRDGGLQYRLLFRAEVELPCASIQTAKDKGLRDQIETLAASIPQS